MSYSFSDFTEASASAVLSFESVLCRLEANDIYRPDEPFKIAKLLNVVTKSQTLAGNRWFNQLHIVTIFYCSIFRTTNPPPYVAMEIFLDML